MTAHILMLFYFVSAITLVLLMVTREDGGRVVQPRTAENVSEKSAVDNTPSSEKKGRITNTDWPRNGPPFAGIHVSGIYVQSMSIETLGEDFYEKSQIRNTTS